MSTLSTIALDFRARRRVSQNYVDNVDHCFLVGPHCPQVTRPRARLPLSERLKANGPHGPHGPRARQPLENKRPGQCTTRQLYAPAR